MQKYKKILTFAAKIKEKMHFFIRFVRKYPLSVLCILFIDKWTHLIMYGGTCSVIWLEYLRRHDRIDWRKILLLPVLGMILLGGLMELLQAYCTTTRSGEWLDFWADSAGVLLGNALGLLFWWISRSRK